MYADVDVLQEVFARRVAAKAAAAAPKLSLASADIYSEMVLSPETEVTLTVPFNVTGSGTSTFQRRRMGTGEAHRLAHHLSETIAVASASLLAARARAQNPGVLIYPGLPIHLFGYVRTAEWLTDRLLTVSGKRRSRRSTPPDLAVLFEQEHPLDWQSGLFKHPVFILGLITAQRPPSATLPVGMPVVTAAAVLL